MDYGRLAHLTTTGVTEHKNCVNRNWQPRHLGERSQFRHWNAVVTFRRPTVTYGPYHQTNGPFLWWR